MAYCLARCRVAANWRPPDCRAEEEKLRIAGRVIAAITAMMTITANNSGKPYSAEVPLSVKVEPNSADASYTNGILQVIFKKKGPEPPKGVNVRIN